MLPDLNQDDFKNGHARMRAGKCIIDLEPHPVMLGKVYIPDTARERKGTDTASIGRVFAIGYGSFWETHPSNSHKFVHYPGVMPHEIPVGARVVIRTTLGELQETRILTDVRRIDAVIEEVEDEEG